MTTTYYYFLNTNLTNNTNHIFGKFEKFVFVNIKIMVFTYLFVRSSP